MNIIFSLSSNILIYIPYPHLEYISDDKKYNHFKLKMSHNLKFELNSHLKNIT